MFPSSGGNKSECDLCVDISTHKKKYKTSCITLYLKKKALCIPKTLNQRVIIDFKHT
jgi:hypothetical protein